MDFIKKIGRDECGMALPVMLVILLLASFIVVPVVTFMGTNVISNRLVDDSSNELYAADSGVEKALWHVRYDYELVLPSQGEDPISINFAEEINDKTVAVTISYEDTQMYKITSTATGDNDGNTTIESLVSVSYLDLAWLFDSAITSPGDVTIKPHSDVTGDVVYGGDLDNKGTIDGDEIIDPLENWP